MRDLPGSETREQSLGVLKTAVEVISSLSFLCKWNQNSLIQAAKLGAEATIKMKAKAGRASYVNVTQLTQKDPGAEAVAVWMEAILNKLK